LQSEQYREFLKYRSYKKNLLEGKIVNTDSLIASNPNYYQAYQLAGNELFNEKQYEKAIGYYRQALSKEIATKGEENDIKNRISVCEEKLNKANKR
jgi:tetratricopeptide (TPR) repeat protein